MFSISVSVTVGDHVGRNASTKVRGLFHGGSGLCGFW